MSLPNSHGLPTIEVGGETRILGHVPVKQSRNVSAYGAIDLLPESEWAEFDLTTDPGYAAAVPILDQNQKGACFPAGTMIRMGDGTRKPIEDVRLLDEVLTAEGNIRPVTRTMVHKETESIYSLQLQGHRHLKATAEHPILTKNGYVPISELSRGDMVAMPRYAASGINVIQTADYVERRHLAIKSSTAMRSVAGRKAGVMTRIALPDLIELTPEFGRIIGLFLAEGHTDPSKTRWTFNINERDTLVDDLVSLLRDTLGLSPTVVEKEHRNTCIVTIYGKQWAVLFESLCSAGSASKRVHPDLMRAPLAFQEAMLRGWADGDSAGHESRGERGGVTVSRWLAGAMYDIATAVGLAPAIRHYPAPQLSEGVKSRQPRWDILWMENPQGNNWRREQDDKYVWRRVDGVVRDDFSGNVFNLEVEGDHSYVAEGIGVHNCNGHAAASSLMCARWLAGQTPVKLSPWFVYSILCGGWDQGSNIGDALRLLSEKGTCRYEAVPYATINPNRLTAANYTEATNFKIEIGNPAKSFKELMTLAQLRIPFNYSIHVGNGFDNLDSEGCPPARSGAGNHAVMGGIGAKKMKNGKWAIKWQNSWGTRWGQSGYAWFHEGHIANQSYFESYGVAATVDTPGDPTNPPLAV